MLQIPLPHLMAGPERLTLFKMNDLGAIPERARPYEIPERVPK